MATEVDSVQDRVVRFRRSLRDGYVIPKPAIADLEANNHIPEVAALLHDIKNQAWRVALNRRRSMLDGATDSPTCPRLASARQRLRELVG